MKFLTPIYCCTECKKIVISLDQLLFVEENSVKGFCSEECIEFFYSPMLKYYEEILYSFRTELKLQNESITYDLSEQELMEEVIHTPSEIWRNENELHEEVFSYIKHFTNSSVIVLCTVLRLEPSFIFLMTKTSSQELVSKFRIGERIVINSDSEVEDLIQELEGKKSQLLAELLSKRKDDDIPFEEFSEYDNFLDITLESPDETFEVKDREGDLLVTSIKSFTKNNKNFFYIIITLKNMNILSFPTEDMELYSEFRIGKKTSSNFKN